MSSSAAFRLVTDRDLEILTALDRCPHTTSQLLKISETFNQPFRNERRLRERVQQLCEAGRVRRWQYATAGQGAPNYYTLARLGYQLLHGADAQPPTKRAFEAVHIARQHHTMSLAAFIVHTAVAAHRTNLAFTNFYRENSLKLDIGQDALYPDASFQLIDESGAEYRFFAEIDNGTERVRSSKDLESWERKIRLYDRYQDSTDKRFRVLVITTRSTVRTQHILDAAASLVSNTQRSLFYGCTLAEYLAQADALHARCFCDHRGNRIAMLPGRKPARAFLPPRPSLALA